MGQRFKGIGNIYTFKVVLVTHFCMLILAVTVFHMFIYINTFNRYVIL